MLAPGWGSQGNGFFADNQENWVMTTELQESMTAGVFIEFCDAQGNTLGQTVFTGWQGRPLPAVGDLVRCAVHSSPLGRRRKLTGRVISRQFDLQHEDDQPCVWVRMVVRKLDTLDAPKDRRASTAGFSTN
jgi:hypothetical protein